MEDNYDDLLNNELVDLLDIEFDALEDDHPVWLTDIRPDMVTTW
jgi:hypothetical protein